MKKLTLRLTDALHGALKELSEREDRSLHGEIIYRLKRAVESINPRFHTKESEHAE